MLASLRLSERCRRPMFVPRRPLFSHGSPFASYLLMTQMHILCASTCLTFTFPFVAALRPVFVRSPRYSSTTLPRAPSKPFGFFLDPSRRSGTTRNRPHAKPKKRKAGFTAGLRSSFCPLPPPQAPSVTATPKMDMSMAMTTSTTSSMASMTTTAANAMATAASTTMSMGGDCKVRPLSPFSFS